MEDVRDIAAVEVVNVSKSFGSTRALQGVSLRIEPGECRALVGRNGAGKSTLVGLLTGLIAPDEGELRFNGNSAPRLDERQKWRDQVACVHQRSNVVPTLTVEENLMLNRMPARFGFIDYHAARHRALELIEQWGIDADPDDSMSGLSVADAQLVEIARELSLGSSILILDEPTARLEREEVDRLFDALRVVQASGNTIVYISHHLEEIYQLTSSVTVLRDGAHILTRPTKDLGQSELVEAMVGEQKILTTASTDQVTGASEVIDLVVPRPEVSWSNLLSVEEVKVGGPQGVSLTVDGGEIVGLAGHAGSGSVDLAHVLAGLEKPTAGIVKIAGEPLPYGIPAESVRMGVGFVPKDRGFNGFAPQLGVADNVTLSALPWISRLGFVDSHKRESLTSSVGRSLAVKMAAQDQEVRELSGGNQQKVVVGRALASNPRVLVLVQPTAGVDIASKGNLMSSVMSATQLGMATVIVSDEVDELRACDRVLVFFKGSIVAEFQRGWKENDLVAELEGMKK